MRFYRITFLGGLAIGYVLGAQAGRERYEQLKQLARKAAESPAMQQTAGALQAQATATAKTAKEQGDDRRAQERVQGHQAQQHDVGPTRHSQAQVRQFSVGFGIVGLRATGRRRARRAVMTTALSFQLTAASATTA